MCACQKSYTSIIMTSITWAGPRCVQELGTFLGPQNRTQGRCVPERHAVSDRIELAWIPRDKMPSCRCRGGMLPLLCRKLGSHRRPPPPTAGPSCGYSPCLVLLMNLSQCLQAEGGHGPGRGRRVLYVANEAALYTALTITTNTRVLAVCKQTE